MTSTIIMFGYYVRQWLMIESLHSLFMQIFDVYLYSSSFMSGNCCQIDAARGATKRKECGIREVHSEGIRVFMSI